MDEAIRSVYLGPLLFEVYEFYKKRMIRVL